MHNFSDSTDRNKASSAIYKLTQTPMRISSLLEPIGDFAHLVKFLKKSYHDKNKLIRFVSIIIFLFFCHASSHAQVTDTASRSKNLQTKNAAEAQKSVPNDNPIAKPKYHSPRKAALMSTIVPGLGQAYNKKYWKIPIIYAGIVGLAYSFDFNQTKYVTYRDAYKYRLNGGSLANDNYPTYNDETLNALQAYYHRYRNLTVIGASLLYIMNIVDASVDAHMFTFDVSDNLSFHIRPTLINTVYVNHYTTGLSLNISF